MRKITNAVFGTIVGLAWANMAVIVSENFFKVDRLEEVTMVVCFASVGAFLAFATIYYTEELRSRNKNVN